MSTRPNLFSRRDQEWFEKVDRIMKEAVQEAIEENQRLGIVIGEKSLAEAQAERLAATASSER